MQIGKSALKVQEFFGSKICAESGFCYHIISQVEGCGSRQYAVAAMSDIGKGSAMNKCRNMFQSLYQIWLNGILEQSSHSPFRMDIRCCYRFAIISIGYNNAAKPFLQIGYACSQTEYGHNFRGYRNIKAAFSGNPVSLSTKAYNNVTKCTVIHIHDMIPYHLTRINVQHISLFDMIIHHS